MTGKLILEDNSQFEGQSFGAEKSVAGEAVFSTGMMGYPESLTDPSYKGQILILTYPLIGNYGIPEKVFWESDHIQISGLIVSNYIDTPSHFQSKKTLSAWFREEQIPLIEIKDTRFLTQKIREKGVMLGKIVFDQDIPFYDPNNDNLVAEASTRIILKQGLSLQAQKTILLIDCGAKNNIQRCLLKRGVRVITVPWNFDPFRKIHLGGVMASQVQPATSEVTGTGSSEVNSLDGIVISNGPGDARVLTQTIATVKKAIAAKIPVLGICLGHQLLILAASEDIYKLKYGHRGQNQPCTMVGGNRCFITSQNHGFAAKNIPKGFKPWFVNANDGTNEGIIHKNLPFMSVQFHPEACPGPTDTEWIFDYFLKRIMKHE